MIDARLFHTATRLPNGNVLLVRGANDLSSPATARVHVP